MERLNVERCPACGGDTWDNTHCTQCGAYACSEDECRILAATDVLAHEQKNQLAELARSLARSAASL